MRRMSPETFHTVSRVGGTDRVEIVEVRGTLTSSTSSEFQEAVKKASGAHLILDLTSVPSVDSMAVGALVRAFVTCNKSGRKLVLVGANHRVRNVLQLTGIDPLFENYATVAEAEEAIR